MLAREPQISSAVLNGGTVLGAHAWEYEENNDYEGISCKGIG